MTRPNRPPRCALEKELGKELFESWEHLLVDEAVQVAQYVSDGPFIHSGARFVESYLEGNMWLELHVRAFSDAKPVDFCAIFKRSDLLVNHGDISRVSVAKCESCDAYLGNGQQNGPVLVNVVKSAQNPQGMQLGVGSEAWLQRLDSRFDGWIDVLKLAQPRVVISVNPSSGPRVSSVVAVLEDGELDRARALGTGDGKLPHDRVQRGSEIVQELADYKTQSGIGPTFDVRAQDIVAGLFIELRGDKLRCVVREGFDLRLQVIEVFSRPSAFEVCVCE